MIREFSDEQFRKLRTRLGEIGKKHLHPHAKLNEELNVIRSASEALLQFKDGHPFETKADEIDFHKHVYPAFRCLHIYHIEVHDLLEHIPFGDRRIVRAYYNSRLEIMRHEIARHAMHHHYLKLKARELDELYFTSGGDKTSVMLPILPEADGNQTTPMGYLSARFKAHELLSHFILTSLENLEPASLGTKPRSSFQWTGEVINLIEIAYGIYLNRQVNEGRLGIVEFFDGLGEFFGVDLGIPKNGFKDLSKRKRLSKTNFTDRMREQLLNKMDEEDAWRSDGNSARRMA